MGHRLLERLARAGRNLISLEMAPPPSPPFSVEVQAPQQDWSPLPASAVGQIDWSADLAAPRTGRATTQSDRCLLDTAALEHLARLPEQRIDVGAFIERRALFGTPPPRIVANHG